jgi:hypothetical protein
MKDEVGDDSGRELSDGKPLSMLFPFVHDLFHSLRLPVGGG